ncbi:MAG: hypothetical protein R3C68_05230 [Myxococcota bacterium]
MPESRYPRGVGGTKGSAEALGQGAHALGDLLANVAVRLESHGQALHA